jgi:hypothetical protein
MSGGVGDRRMDGRTVCAGVAVESPLLDLFGRDLVTEAARPGVFILVVCGVFSRLGAGDDPVCVGGLTIGVVILVTGVPASCFGLGVSPCLEVVGCIL